MAATGHTPWAWLGAQGQSGAECGLRDDKEIIMFHAERERTDIFFCFLVQLCNLGY